MRRRDHLKLLSALLASLISSRCGGASPNNTVNNADTSKLKKQRILIVGAGIAGLAAAKTLLQTGYDVLVLEARERIGGRIWTSSAWPDTPMDLGASWIHGTEGNPLTAIASGIHARTAATSYENAILYDTNGQMLDSNRESQIKKLQGRIEQALQAAQDDEHDQSVQNSVESALQWGSLSPEQKKWVDFILNGTIEQEYAGSTSALSTLWYDSGDSFGGADVLFLDGYKTVIDFLAKDIPIVRGEQARQIQWDSGKVTITTNQSVYTADRTIITLPLGVLKAGTVSFLPQLPEKKRQAIAALEMGVLNKCYLRFPKVFWPSEFDWLEYIPSNKGRWVEWVSFARPTKQAILLGFNAADFGREIESWTNEQVVTSAMQTLRTMFGPDIPEPIAYQITRWASDPYAFGSYSFNALGSTPEMRDHLAQNLDEKIYFAGEATHRKYFSTVHGAYLSGLRAAQEIMGSSKT